MRDLPLSNETYDPEVTIRDDCEEERKIRAEFDVLIIKEVGDVFESPTGQSIINHNAVIFRQLMC